MFRKNHQLRLQMRRSYYRGVPEFRICASHSKHDEYLKTPFLSSAFMLLHHYAVRVTAGTLRYFTAKHIVF